MKTVHFDSTAYQIPDCWEDCTAEQLTTLLPLTLLDAEEMPPAARARIRWQAVRILIPAPEKVMAKVAVEDRHRLTRLVRWIWTGKELRKKPFDAFTVAGVSYILPQPGYADTSAIEIAMACMKYMAFAREERPDPSAVFGLIATICRPERKDLKKFRASTDWTGDRREPYNTILADERAAVFQKTLKSGTVIAILRYFEWMNAGFLRQYQDVYQEDGDTGDPLYKNGEGLITTLMEVAKTGTFGDFDRVCSQNGHTVWMFLKDNNMKVRRQLEIE